jgi:hypothetical protein
MMVLILIKLILAHLLGDFVFQPAALLRSKEKKKLGGVAVYAHGLIHFTLIMLLVWDWSFLKWAILIAGIHFIIDVVKIYVQQDGTKRLFFLFDQLAHFLTICIVYCFYTRNSYLSLLFFNDNVILLITFIVLLTSPASISIKTFIARWAPEAGEKNPTLHNAGKYIGIFERLLVFMSIASGHWEAVGFILAAKSIFRFGDLTNSRDRNLTEYVLIGTLLSFGSALLAGILYTGILAYWH